MSTKRFYDHLLCEYYILKYDMCKKFQESNMSRRVKLCEHPNRKGCEKI